MAVCITDAPLRIGTRPVVADASATHGVALISLPALGAVQTRRRARDAVIRLVDGLVGQADQVVHFAAESHVDRSILGPAEFVRTNIEGTFQLLEACRRHWKGSSAGSGSGGLFHHVSTDEVYGSLGATGLFTEETRYDPSSPYSASKASSDHLVRAYARTYGLRTRVTNCSNNYGPYQFPEKLIPLMILNCLERKPLPVYGKGENIRDWLYVSDHCEAIWRVIEAGKDGETYNVGGHNEVKNLDVVHLLCSIIAEETKTPEAELPSAILMPISRRRSVTCAASTPYTPMVARNSATAPNAIAMTIGIRRWSSERSSRSQQSISKWVVGWSRKSAETKPRRKRRSGGWVDEGRGLARGACCADQALAARNNSAGASGIASSGNGTAASLAPGETSRSRTRRNAAKRSSRPSQSQRSMRL